MEWLKTLLEKHTNDGETDIEAVMNAIKEEFPKHAVTKSVYNEQAEKLKAANSTLDTLKKSNKDNESLQEELKTYKEKVSELKQKALESARDQSIKEALAKAGATDIDYLVYKMGELETDSEGKVVDLEGKITGLQENYASFFQSEVPATTNDFKPLGGVDLPGGKSASLYSREVIAQMRPEEINANWDAIKQSLENGE